MNALTELLATFGSVGVRTMNAESDSDTSSVGHDFRTGEPVMRSYREEQYLRRRMERLGRIRGLPQGVPYVPLTRVVDKPPDFSEETVASRGVAERPKVTPYEPVNDPVRRRRLSAEALHKARHNVAERMGEPPRMVREPTYGMLLPRESIVTITKPLHLVDEQGEEVIVAPPVVGFGMDARYIHREMEMAVDDGTRVHYRLTVDIINKTRQRRVLRDLDVE
jgi:hypothetical protein